MKMNSNPVEYRKSGISNYSRFFASVLVIGGILPLTVNALPNPATSPASVSGWGVDDWNTSTLKSNPASSVDGNGNNVPGIYNGACSWITTAMTAAYKAPGTAASGAQWNWAAAPFAGELGDLTVTDYKPWVVQPITTVNGFSLDYTGTIFNANFGGANQGTYKAQAQDAGGATFGLNYTRAAGDPQNMVFIQALQDITTSPTGSTTTYKLDNNAGSGFPQYGGASTYGNNNAGQVSKMADGPFRSEQDPATEDFSYDIEFQTVLASYSTINGKGFYTLYPLAEAWGFTYVNSDVRPVPEPSTYIAGALMLLPFGTSALRRLRALRKAE